MNKGSQINRCNFVRMTSGGNADSSRTSLPVPYACMCPEATAGLWGELLGTSWSSSSSLVRASASNYSPSGSVIQKAVSKAPVLPSSPLASFAFRRHSNVDDTRLCVGCFYTSSQSGEKKKSPRREFIITSHTSRTPLALDNDPWCRYEGATAWFRGVLTEFR